METVTQFGNDSVPRLSASFSFYAMLSLAPIFVLAIVLAGSILGTGSTRASILHEVQASLGNDSRALVETLIEKTTRPGAGTIATIISLAVTFFSASNLFIQVNQTFQVIWKIQRTATGIVKAFLINRLIAFVMVLGFGILVFAWLALDSWLAWVQDNTSAFHLGEIISFVVSTIFLTLAFSTSYRFIPRNRACWGDVWIGGFVAGLGVSSAKYLLSQYFSKINVAGAYGPAGALVVVLLWIYYASQIYFFGAELVFTYSHLYGSRRDIDEAGLTYS